jgi:hypothetical protein
VIFRTPDSFSTSRRTVFDEMCQAVASSAGYQSRSLGASFRRPGPQLEGGNANIMPRELNSVNSLVTITI